MALLKYPIVLAQPPLEEDAKDLQLQLGEHNKNINPQYENPKPYAFFIKNEGNLLGGAAGNIWIGSIRIDRLFVHTSIQGQGYGKELLRKVEELGRTYKAPLIVLETLSFQNALDFYLKQGYKVTLEEGGYLDGTVMYRLRKRVL